MPTIKIVQDVLAPEYQKVTKLSGYHPSQLLKIIPDTLLNVFRQQTPALFEDELKWDTSDDPVMFFSKWRLRDGKDRRTKVVVSVIVEGYQSKQDLSGKVTVALRCQILTEINYQTVIDRSLYWLYDRFFYKRHRMEYIEEARRRMIELEDKIKAYFGTLERVKTREVT